LCYFNWNWSFKPLNLTVKLKLEALNFGVWKDRKIFWIDSSLVIVWYFPVFSNCSFTYATKIDPVRLTRYNEYYNGIMGWNANKVPWYLKLNTHFEENWSKRISYQDLKVWSSNHQKCILIFSWKIRAMFSKKFKFPKKISNSSQKANQNIF
jgi:hypothetical protein